MLIKKFFTFVVLLTLASLCFGTIELLHFKFLAVKLLAKTIVFHVVLTCCIIAVIIFFTEIKKFFNLYEKIISLLMILFVFLYFGLLVPTVLDRSLTFYTIDRLEKMGGSFDKNKLLYLYRDEYLLDYQVDKIRLTELKELALVEVRDNCIVITTKGKRVVKFGRLYRKYFLPHKRLLDNSYIDFNPQPREGREGREGKIQNLVKDRRDYFCREKVFQKN